jgi:hypothetical protein
MIVYPKVLLELANAITSLFVGLAYARFLRSNLSIFFVPILLRELE